MERTTVFRGLRIAWSVVFGILCVPLIGLWVRSYSVWDIVWRSNTGLGPEYSIHSIGGRIKYAFAHGPIVIRQDDLGWRLTHVPASLYWNAADETATAPRIGYSASGS